ncbi:hypothetical protein [Comamonas odontotermitis]|uniref:hypothetical protein n=1 Tax=Comamonas odontotermitis TaxID=379895 RepID=UPI001CC4289B|nr:hypothetical protein [Comamonas odontotermitis]UBB18807.1 hypothetical protein LAD35_09350 [Comamonas odontotermitis]
MNAQWNYFQPVMRNEIIFTTVAVVYFSVNAAQPPQWCDLNEENSRAGCDQYFSSRQEAADYLSEKYKITYLPDYEYTAPASVGAYTGYDVVSWTREGRFWNPTSNSWVRHLNGKNIFKYCPPIPKGSRYNPGSDEAIACGGSEISISGPSLTTALPQGPSLPQKISILTGGYRPLAENAFSYQFIENGKIIFQDSIKTDSNGEAFLTYVPPYFLNAKIEIKATCSECTNTALQEISVQGLLLPASVEEPQICRR